MLKVALVQMVFNGMKYIPQSFAAMAAQTHPDTEIIAVINGNEDGGKEYIQKNFPQVTIIDPGENLRFVRGHNLVFSQVDADFFQLVNQDLILEPNYVEEMLKAFADPQVGAANGKIFQYDFKTNQKIEKLDTTGVSIAKSGRGRSRGQHEIDHGQYDTQLDLISVDGAACMYRKIALEAVKYLRPDGQTEYFDLDFEMYWEDVDLGWRIFNAGWKCKFVPEAIGYHGRTAAASPGGYKKVWAFIQHHRQIPGWILEFNYKNHIFLFIKNSPKWYWQFFAREFFYNCFAIVWETKTYKIVPTMFRQFSSIWKKRKYIQQSRKVSIAEIEKLLA
jgi:GT2 family glycosyltransferase